MVLSVRLLGSRREGEVGKHWLCTAFVKMLAGVGERNGKDGGSLVALEQFLDSGIGRHVLVRNV